MTFQNGTLYDPYKDKHKKSSILIEEGIIKKVGKFQNLDMKMCAKETFAMKNFD